MLKDIPPDSYDKIRGFLTTYASEKYEYAQIGIDFPSVLLDFNRQFRYTSRLESAGSDFGTTNILS